jgi:hypothetical protein
MVGLTSAVAAVALCFIPNAFSTLTAIEASRFAAAEIRHAMK